jgi:hypothetical protein
MFAISFSSVFMCFACVHAHVSNVLDVSYICCNCFYLDVLKVDRGCCACCNASHLPQLPAAAARGLCMEGSGAADVEGCGSIEAWRSGAGEPRLCVQKAVPRASRRPGASAAVDWEETM